jgi:hypothetical protein
MNVIEIWCEHVDEIQFAITVSPEHTWIIDATDFFLMSANCKLQICKANVTAGKTKYEQ